VAAELTGKVVVVTGAAAGVGRATVRAFGRRGAHVALLARGADGLERAREEVEAEGVRALALEVDVSDAAAVDAAAEEVERALGPIEVWVNDAMTAVLARVSETDADEFRRVTEVTYLGQVHGTMAALRRMRHRDRGAIVLVGSALAFRGIPLQASYCGAKHATKGFFESLRTELLAEKSRVHLTMVQLPALNTPQFETVKTSLDHHPQPVPPIYQPEVAAEAIVWAATHRRRQTWIGTSTVLTIIGSFLAPWFADRYLARTGIDAQQMPDVPIDPDRPDYLWKPLPGDRGAHGRFDEQARERDPMIAASRHRAAITAGAAAGAAAILAAVFRRS